MAINLTRMTTNVNNIQALSDLPNQTDGLDSQGLKERFDKAGSDIKSFINTTMLPEIEQLLNTLYPIGRGFIDFTETDYSNYLGFTWERELVGMTPVGLDTSDSDFNEVGKTGGEKTHKLIASELPKIEGTLPHTANDERLVGGAFSHFQGDISYTETIPTGATIKTRHKLSFGNDEAHNNLQPYQVVSYWKRVS